MAMAWRSGAIWHAAMAISAFYGAAEGVTDGGWRCHSQSNLARLYADAGWRFGDSEIHLVASGAATGLGVVGPTPFELIAAQSPSPSTPFPRPPGTRIGSLALNGKTRLADNWQVEGVGLCAQPASSAMSTAMTAISSAAPTRSSFGGKLCLQDDAFPAHALHRRQDRWPSATSSPSWTRATPAIPFTAGAVLRHGGPHLHRQHQPAAAPCR